MEAESSKSPIDNSRLTPMMQQYRAVKDQHPDVLLFYRMGDFYELFFEDAVTASQELELTLTGRQGGGERVPMAGVPHHSAETYIARLLAKGYRVAICDQVEDPALAKGLVKREVTRLFTPGTLVEANFLSEKKNNFLASAAWSSKGFALAYGDISTGELRVTQFERGDQLLSELERISPAEVIFPVPDNLWQNMSIGRRPGTGGGEMLDPAVAAFFPSVPLTGRAAYSFSPERAQKNILSSFGVAALEGFGLQDFPLAVQAVGGLLNYLEETQGGEKKNPFLSVGVYRLTDFMLLDAATQRNLEIATTNREGNSKGSLLSAVDRTSTAMGGRKLRRWLTHPLMDPATIRERQDAIEELVYSTSLRMGISQPLGRIRDLERLSGRLGSGSANARDLVALADSLLALPAIMELTSSSSSPLLGRYQELPAEASCQAEEIKNILVEHPPIALTEGGLVRPGFEPALDELRGLLSDNREWLEEFERGEKERTGIRSLKLGYNKNFGFFIEVTNANRNLIPADYQRKQTLVNAERYITPGLKMREQAILSAEDRAGKMEYSIFSSLRDRLLPLVPLFQQLADWVAELDVLVSLAEVAVRNHYIRPEVTEEESLEIVGGRHPVLEQILPPGAFVPNDLSMDPENSQLIILTGPNMAGKSTYMRQAALIVLLAQMGSFVPARSAKIGLVDRIFTRVGAVDDLATGQSTFMVEMNETAAILNQATKRSLILLDEIGRGTSTFDGISIAWSICEHLSEKIKARTVFATHYHELTNLRHPAVKNARVLVEETGEEVVFLRRVVPGTANRSYGIEVARLAGLPHSVVHRARAVLKEIEKRNQLSAALKSSVAAEADLEQLPLFFQG